MVLAVRTAVSVVVADLAVLAVAVDFTVVAVAVDFMAAVVVTAAATAKPTERHRSLTVAAL